MKKPLAQASPSYHARQFVKFLVVGCSNFAISFTVFYLCYEKWHVFSRLMNDTGEFGKVIMHSLSRMGIESPEGGFANIISYSAGIANSFFWNRIWTFRVLTETGRQLKRFVSLNVFCLFLSSFIIFIFVDIFGWPYRPVWVVTMSFITVLNFIGNKFWVFRRADGMRNSAYSGGVVQ